MPLARPQPSPPPTSQLLHGRYSKCEKLGSGAFSSVYRATDLQNPGADCALKVVSLSGLDVGVRRKCIDEAQFLLQISSKNVVRALDSWIQTRTSQGRQKETLFIVLELALGGDLHDKITSKKRRGGCFAEKQILCMFSQMVIGLKACHDKKLLHRDIKSRNVLMFPAPELASGYLLKLGDFGMSYALTSSIDTACSVVGTPYYMSPEIYGRKKYGFTSDVWSLGVLLYEMCTSGHYPFLGKETTDVANQVKYKPYEAIPPHYSSGLRNLVELLLKKNPRHRPTVNEILQLPVMRKSMQSTLVVSSGRRRLLGQPRSRPSTPPQPVREQRPTRSAPRQPRSVSPIKQQQQQFEVVEVASPSTAKPGDGDQRLETVQLKGVLLKRLPGMAHIQYIVPLARTLFQRGTTEDERLTTWKQYFADIFPRPGTAEFAELAAEFDPQVAASPESQDDQAVQQDLAAPDLADYLESVHLALSVKPGEGLDAIAQPVNDAEAPPCDPKDDPFVGRALDRTPREDDDESAPAEAHVALKHLPTPAPAQAPVRKAEPSEDSVKAYLQVRVAGIDSRLQALEKELDALTAERSDVTQLLLGI